MIKKFYYWLYHLTSRPEEKGEYAGGYIQSLIRKSVLFLCKGSAGKILEIGCGSGLFVIKLAQQNQNAQICSIDNDKEMLNYVKIKSAEKDLKNISLFRQNADSLDFGEGDFDAVICINFLLMMGSLDVVRQIITQMTRVCKKGGKLIFEFRNSSNIFFAAKYKLAKYYDGTLAHPLNCYSFKQIALILEGLGLKITRKIDLGAFLFGFPAPIIVIEAEKR